jgi:lipopolysaccharide transport system ATP-binding protein
MNKPAIEFSGVTKIYSIRERGYQTLRDSFSRSLNKFRQKFKSNSNNNLSNTENNYIRAIDDVSFKVDRGEALGIIGANGSGKTTILRLLAKVTIPSSGEISVSGKVAPLIHVGAGFHPELTGRENIYLYATIMGLSKQEIDEKYNDIVSFAELERFMDTPVKRYSSGMYVRLGFAVVANIDPDIFLIDEILSVGDLRFQRKCLNTMSNIRKTDKSIVFVSHNLSSVKGLCDRVIWLDKGEIRKEGVPSDLISAYTSYMTSKTQFVQDTSYIDGKTRWGTGEVRFTNVELLNSEGKRTNIFAPGDEITVRLEYKANKRINSPVFWVGIINDNEVKVFGSYYNKERVGEYFIKGKGALNCKIDSRLMRPGSYYVMAGIYGEVGNLAIDRIGRACTFTIRDEKVGDFERLYGYGAPGVINIRHEWVRNRKT